MFRPGLSIQAINLYFLGREPLVEAFSTIRLALGDRIFNQVLVGRDGWLFYTGDRAIDDYQRSNPFSPGDLRKVQEEFDALYEQLQRKGILLIVVIAPDKTTLYGEYMPQEIDVVGRQSRLGQFIAYMHDHGKTPVIDLRSPLVEAAKTEQMYFKTDTHWNPAGSYIAYRAILQRLSPHFAGMDPHPWSAYNVFSKYRTMDLSILMGLPTQQELAWGTAPKFPVEIHDKSVLMPDGTWAVRISTNEDQGLPSALIFHDSYFYWVISYLQPHFRQITSVWHHPDPTLWNMDWVDLFHPDVVIIEYAERYLNDNFDPPLSR